MRDTDPSEPASNWDFTPVYDLLQSPAYNGSSELSRSGYSDISQPHSENRPRILQPCSKSSTSPPKSQLNSHGLGDFGSLWDIIHQGPDSFRSLGSNETMIQAPTGHQTHASFRPPITILKRQAQDGLAGKTHESHSSSTPIAVPVVSEGIVDSKDDTIPPSHPSYRSSALNGPRHILKGHSSDHENAPRYNQKTIPKVVTNIHNTSKTPKTGTSTTEKRLKLKEQLEAFSSESSAEVDSDSSATVFDRPFSQRPNHLAFTPGQVGAPDARHSRDETPPSSFDDMASTLNSENFKNIISTSAGIRVLPIGYKTATERRIGLMSKLLKDFPEYAQLVSRVGCSPRLSKKESPSRPVHVFVDMSNIMVGFHDSVKVSRDIPISTRIRRLHMSFANFSLIMERGRSASKRVLVGSDRLPSIEEAKSLGYEANILDRVHKAKHGTPRHSKFRKTPGNTNNQGSGGSETANASNERWVEQGVDEILHLKILESLLDTDEPATIVLATGDAATAEYSGGFMRMVERALQRGWTVEVVSFSQVTSYAYRKKEFREKWQDSFRLIELDTYVEELFE